MLYVTSNTLWRILLLGNIYFHLLRVSHVLLASLPLLTYLFGHYNLLQVLASANLRRHTSRAITAWRQFRIPSVLSYSSTWLAKRWEGRPCLRHPPPDSDSKTLRTGLELSIRATWPSHRRRCILMPSLRRCDRIYRTASGSIVCAILLYRRKVHKSYVGFSSRRRLMLAHLQMSASRSQHHIL